MSQSKGRRKHREETEIVVKQFDSPAPIEQRVRVGDMILFYTEKKLTPDSPPTIAIVDDIYKRANRKRDKLVLRDFQLRLLPPLANKRFLPQVLFVTAYSIMAPSIRELYVGKERICEYLETKVDLSTHIGWISHIKRRPYHLPRPKQFIVG